jgi:outer membrane protein OmpA-like peptidoglycan-associated protein/tetratricopeptide (TPR) repeat protein
MNVKKIILLLAASVALNANAQSKKALKDAQLTYASENYCEAASKMAIAYTKITKNTPKALSLKAEYAFKTGESFRRIDDAAQAVTWFEKAILLKYQEKDPIVYLYAGDMYRVLADFPKAEANYKLYQQKVPDDARAEIGIKSAQMNQEFKANRTRHTITNVSALNTDGFDMAPMFIDKKDVQLAFTSTSEKYGIQGGKAEDPISCSSYSDIFVAEIDKKGQFTKVVPIVGDSINTEDNEGAVCIDGRAKLMFFTRCPNVKKENMGCEIWMSEAGGNKWEKPVELPLKSNDTVSVGHPCVTEDGKFLIFASDDASGLGGRDLWYSEYDKRGGTWSAPKNMGPEINTAGDELFPTFAKNGDLIYASNGLPGMGGLDMFRAARVGTENKWENPTNYGSPINSDFNDYAMVEVDDRKGYFTSERKGVVGDNLRPDIYMYEMPPNIFSLCVNVFDLSDKKRQTKIEGVKVVVQGNVAADRWEGLTTKDGSICWDKKPNSDRYINENSSYSITISKEKYYENKTPAQFTTVGLTFNQDFVIDMGLLPIKPIRLPEVRYPLAQWTFVNDSSCMSLDSLNYVITLLDEFPGLVLELSSHTDPRGGNIYNQVLSENRAKACYVYLVNQKGVDPRRIVPVGKGELEPRTMYLKDGKYFEKQLADNSAAEVRMTEAYMAPFKKTDKKKFEQLQQYNRRTEGKVVTLDFDPKTAPPANPDYMVFKKLPPSNK